MTHFGMKRKLFSCCCCFEIFLVARFWNSQIWCIKDLSNEQRKMATEFKGFRHLDHKLTNKKKAMVIDAKHGHLF